MGREEALNLPQGSLGLGTAPRLSLGSLLPQVSRHLSKLFDSLCKLKFRLDASEKPMKSGLGMYSKEEEYMDFDQECDLSGQVSAPGEAGWQAPTQRTLPLSCTLGKMLRESSGVSSPAFPPP